MSSDNRIGANSVSAVIRAAAARRIGASGTEQSKSAAETGAAQASSDSAPIARLISMAQQAADQGPPIDQNRVATIKAAIADGSYQLDAAKTASSMLRFFGKGD